MTTAPSEASHNAVFKGTSVYFVYSFGAQAPVDVNRVADALLASGLAETVASPASIDVRVSPRYRDLARLMRQAEDVEELQAIISSDPSGLLGWLAKHPRLALQVSKSALSGRLRRRTHRQTSSKTQESVVTDNNGRTSEMIAESVAEAQLVNAIQGHVERSIFQPEYLATEPYVRLRLRRTSIWWDTLTGGAPRNADDEQEEIVCDALMLIHRSGTMQLTLAVQLPSHLPTSDVVDLSHSGTSRVSRVEIAEPLAEGAFSKAEQKVLGGKWLPEMQEGVRWRKIDLTNDRTSIAEIFGLYRDAVEKYSGVRLNSEWLCYPVICIDQLGCCGSELEWLSLHQLDLAAITAKVRDASRLKGEALLQLMPNDLSLSKSNSTFMTEGSTTLVAWPGSKISAFSDHLWTVQVVESALLQFWQLRELERRLAATQTRQEDVRQVQRELIYGLQEFRSARLLFGTAFSNMEVLLSGWNVERLYQRLLESLDQLQQLVANDEARKSARRANVLALSAGFAAIVLGLPAISQSLEIIRALPASSPLAIGPLRDLARSGPGGAWLLYLSLLAVVLILVGRTFWSRPAHRKVNTLSPAGVRWPLGTISVISRPENEVLSESSKTAQAEDVQGTPDRDPDTSL